MRRAPLVLAGTALGLGLVLTYRTPQLATATGSFGTSQTTGSGGTSSGGSSGSASSGSPGSSGTGSSGSSGSSSATQTALGTAVGNPYGQVQVRVTVSGGKITKVVAVQMPSGDPQSYSISSYAAPQLAQQALAAQSAHINGVSGATYTSNAYAQSLQSALTQLGV